MLRTLVTLLFLSVAAAAAAQTADTAIIVGEVRDDTGAPVPGATVTVTHLSTNITTEVVSDERGQYRTPPLRIGEYELRVELTGFRAFTRRGLVLNIGDIRKVDASLQLGALTDTITVDAAAPLLIASTYRREEDHAYEVWEEACFEGERKAENSLQKSRPN